MSTIKKPAPVDVASAWAAQWGEVVTKAQAARILGVDRSTVYRMVYRNELCTAPNGRVLVRPMAEWANSKPQQA